ncbi:hypothetical protein [Georgenia subflava]|uniref:Uncharacterized protein n=1 Tax=Georgenia subflava TaxID=1622177 RepID=A0A6N7EV96_9MICO|nr:hypothetical protein [Georgenia subflava]MPV39054.1 hypothetical protein [Georgenia subflava]
MPPLDVLPPRRSLARLLLVLLLVADVVLIVLHVGFRVNGTSSWYFDLSAERGWGEAFQYLKQLWSVILLAAAWWTSRSPVIVAWALVTAYFLADDAGGIHEGVGRWVINNYLFAPGFGDQRTQLVEVLWMAGVGALLALTVLLTHRRSAAAERAVSWRLVVLFGLLIFFGVIVDGLALAFDDGGTVDQILVVVEDGGELLVLSVVIAYLLGLAENRPDRRAVEATGAAERVD